MELKDALAPPAVTNRRGFVLKNCCSVPSDPEREFIGVIGVLMRCCQVKMVGATLRFAFIGVIVFASLLVGTQRTQSATPPPDPDGVQVYLPAVIKGQGDGAPSPSPTPKPDAEEWLAHLNSYRLMAGLDPVTENPDWENGAYLHSRYMVKNDFIGHTENPDNEWYSTEGEQAAQSSNLAASQSFSAGDSYAIDLWMQAPFHAVGILDPRLTRVGYGSFREDDGGLQMGATLDVIRGRGGLPETVSFPIAWPTDGSTLTLTSHYSEYPDPLSSCSGYQVPAGVPILLQIGSGDLTPQVLSHSFAQGDQPLDHCVFDETNYSNPDATAQSLGRAILGARDTIVLIPRQPLVPGATYTATITLESGSYTWSFDVSEMATQMGPEALNAEIPLPKVNP